MAAPLAFSPYPVTPDGRYFVVRGRLWRMANPELPEEKRARLVAELMKARREVGQALRAKDEEAQRLLRQAVHAAKLGLGERGPPWWTDDAPDYKPAHGAQYTLRTMVRSARHGLSWPRS